MVPANPNRTWKIDLLGTLTVCSRQHRFTHFRTHKTAALLAYLAYDLRPHSRDEVVALLWPNANLENGRNSLSVSLSWLRRQFETLEKESNAVLIADRNLISLNIGAVTTDVQQFRCDLNLAQHRLDSPIETNWQQLQRAVDLYQGRFLSGLYEDWILRESQHLENLWLRALDQLVQAFQKMGNHAAVQHYAGRGIALAPWREANHRQMIEALIAQDQTEMALRHYRGWLQSKSEESPAPSQELRDLMQSISGKTPQVASTFSVAEPFASSVAEPFASSVAKPFASSVAKATDFGVPLRPVATPSDLLTHRTQFFGRRALLERLAAPLISYEAVSPAHSRLTTLTGMGGSGKTRLALETAQRWREQFGQRVWFVPLAGLSDGSLLDVEVRDSLQLKSQSDAPPLDQIVEFLASAPCLLVLDNFETLLPVGAALISLLLARVPQLWCIVTSRQRLEVEGEEELPLRPLPAPRFSKNDLTVEQLLRFAAVRLFVDRAKAARPDFALTRRNAAAVAQLCRSLEGIPLAIELAAARSNVLSPEQMIEHLNSQADWPQSAQCDFPVRHHSMQTVIEASYSLLPPELQQFFRRQSVFRGGWQPAAAAAICEEPRALHFAAQLRACSMLYQQERAEEVRFSCLETLRNYAENKLSADEKTRLLERHCQQFLAHLEAQRPPQANSLNSRAVATFRADLNNYRAALEWALTCDSRLALRLALALQPWCETLGYLTEGRNQLQRALEAAPDAPLEWRARAFYGAGQLSYQQEFAVARPFFEAGLEIYRTLNDLAGIARSLCALSLLAMNLGESQAEAMAREALSLARQANDRDLEFRASFCLSSILLAGDDASSARPLLDGCVAYYRQDSARNAALLSQSLDAQGMLNWQLQQWDKAKALFKESLQLARQMEHGWLCAHSLWGVSTIAREQGDLKSSLQFARESIAFAREGKFRWFIPYLVTNQAYVELDLGWTTHAVLLLGSAQAHHEILEMPLAPLFIPNHEKYLLKARAALDPGEFETLWQRGRTLDFDQAMKLALQPLTLIENGVARLENLFL